MSHLIKTGTPYRGFSGQKTKRRGLRFLSEKESSVPLTSEKEKAFRISPLNGTLENKSLLPLWLDNHKCPIDFQKGGLKLRFRCPQKINGTKLDFSVHNVFLRPAPGRTPPRFGVAGIPDNPR